MIGAMADQRPTVPAPPPETRGDHRLWLMVITDDRVDTFPLPRRGRVVIGRDPGADLQVDRPNVSRSHAALTTGGDLVIEDLGSVNGTHVSGTRLTGGATATLRFGEVFHLGTTAMVVQQAMTVADEPVADVVLTDTAMRDVHATLARIASGDLPVLLLGETGVGKEISADLLHRLSPRRVQPLVKLNCGAFVESLLESELFGHERGAFSGAVAAKAGLLETADGGTVFLDEVGELAPSTQVKLLRVLEERAVRRVGAVKARPIDVRFVAATNRDLEAEIQRGRFRADLYYRLAGATVVVPPLRERQDAIEPLAHALIAAAARRGGRAAPTLAAATLAILRAHRWPGNVRELRNVLERAVLMAPESIILPEHLPSAMIAAAPTAGVPGAAPWWQPDAAAHERARIVAALEASSGHQGKAAALLGMSRRTLLNRLDALGLPRPRKGAS